MGRGREPASSTCVSLFPQDPSEGGNNRFMRVQRVKKLMRHLKPLDHAHLVSDRPGGHTLYQLTIKFPAKGLAKLAQYRILEENRMAATGLASL
jgi:hypothetical protein